MVTNEYQPTPEQMEAVLAFAIEHKCVINPDGWKRYLEGYNRLGHCLCDKDRQCPCADAPDEIKQKARCLCGLFWSSYEAYSIWKSLKDFAGGFPSEAAKTHPESADNSVSEATSRPHKFEALLTWRDFEVSEGKAESGPEIAKNDIESAILIELYKAGGRDLEVVRCAMEHFTEVPAAGWYGSSRDLTGSTIHWAMRFLESLYDLKDKGQTICSARDWWTITQAGVRRVERELEPKERHHSAGG